MRKPLILSFICVAILSVFVAFSMAGCNPPPDGSNPGSEPKEAVATFAMLSDIHLQSEDRNATENFAKAVNLCLDRSQDLDAIVVAGDLIDTTWWSQMVYEDVVITQNNDTRYFEIDYMKSVVEDVVPEGVDFIYTTGNHDKVDFKSAPGKPGINASTEYYAALKSSEKDYFSSELDPNTLYDSGVSMEQLRRYGIGYYKIASAHFITLDCILYWVHEGSYSPLQLDWLDHALANLTTTNPNENIFIVTHNPIKGSVLGSGGTSGANDLKEILVKYPQAITFTGHIHMSNYHEQGISQDYGYTAIEGSSVKYVGTYVYDNTTNFNLRYSPESTGTSLGLLVTVYNNSEVKIERLDFTNNRKAGEDWIIPAISASDRMTAHKTSTKTANNTAPYFVNPTIKGELVDGTDVVNVKFAPATDAEYIVLCYRVKANYADGSSKEFLLDSGFAATTPIKEFCVSFDNASQISSVTVIAEDAMYKQSAPLTISRGNFTAESSYLAPQFESNASSNQLGPFKLGDTLFASSTNFYYDGEALTNYKSMEGNGNVYFTDAFETDYSFSFDVRKMRINRASTVNGYSQLDYRMGVNLATYEYNGRIYSILADMYFGTYDENLPGNRRTTASEIRYYIATYTAGAASPSVTYNMSNFGISATPIPEDTKAKLCSGDGATVSVLRQGSTFTISLDGQPLVTKDMAGAYYRNGLFTKFTANTASTFGIHTLGAEAYFTNASWSK